MAVFTFNSIKERDMDLLLLETLATNTDFVKLLINAVDSLHGKEYEIANVELSDRDSDLGESDVTIILIIEGKRYGFLIENKINAVAMPSQYQRYVERGEKAKRSGIFEEYFIFIFCPNKYRERNSEAKQYPYHLSYESCLAYFKQKDDAISLFRVQQIEKAIRKSRASDNVINANANAFFRDYTEYKETYFSDLNLTTKIDKNGYWPQYATAFKNAYILHKLNFGFVDLYLSNSSIQKQAVERIAVWLKNHGCNVEAIMQKNVKSACIRYEVPPIDIRKNSFKDVSEADVRKWFEAIKSLTDIAALFEDIRVANGL